MEQPEQHIDWEKLLAKLEDLREKTGGDFKEDSEEALQLRMALEMRRRLQSSQPDEKFSDDDGWQRFQERLQRDRRGRVRKMYIVAATAAAVLVAFIGIRTLYRAPETPADKVLLADQRPANGVQIKSSNGQAALLTGGTRQLAWQHGANISASENEIVYTPSSATGVSIDTLIVPRGNRVHIQLADGTGVWVNAGSQLVYPSAFTGSRREVEITGEAYFDVKQDAAKPFVVRANAVQVEVLGTSFNINTYSGNVYTTLETGKVRTAAGADALVLKPGEQAAYEAGAFSRKTVDLRPVTAWKDGQIYFEDEDLATITNTLSRDYDYTFRFEEESLRHTGFTLDMPRPETLQAVLEQISRTSGNIRFRVQDRTVHLYRQ